MKNNLIVPSKIKVGFQNRENTYNGKLAYIIYIDGKGILRKANSWESWRDEKIEPLELDNQPMSGFVLNKGVGGARESYGWDTRNEYIRIYDPRGFEFEITVPNLLFILQECDATRGKGLEGDFVYSWSGKDLVLLPAKSQDYIESTKYTTLQTQKVTKDMMVPGCIYKFKDNELGMYLGRYPYVESVYNTIEEKCTNGYHNYNSWIDTHKSYETQKKHIFLIPDNRVEEWIYDIYVDKTVRVKVNKPYYRTESGFTKIGERLTETIDEDYSNELELFVNGKYSSFPVAFKVEKKEYILKVKKTHWGIENYNDFWIEHGGFYLHLNISQYIERESGQPLVSIGSLYKIVDGKVMEYYMSREWQSFKSCVGFELQNENMYGNGYYDYTFNIEKLKERFLDIKFILESGNIVEVF